MQNIGHNNPPTDEEIFRDRMTDEHAELIAEAEKLAKAKAKPCDSDEYAERLTNYIKRVSVTLSKLERVRVEEKEPVLRQGKIIDGFFKKIATALEDAKRGAQKPLTAWMQEKAAEEQRLRREAAEEARRQAAAKEAEARKLQEQGDQGKAQETAETAQRIEQHADRLEASAHTTTADIVNVRSDKGGSASLRTRWVGEITSRAELDLQALRFHIPEAALKTALNAFVASGGRELRGAKIHQVSDATVR